MALYTISDLHLSISSDKPMDVFRGWENYVEKIKANWNRLVDHNDTVVIPGDLSWGLKLEEAAEDLKFIDKLNGKKIIGKGNHDLWWSTRKKIEEMMHENGISSIDILYNNAFRVDDFAICGTRGWFYDAVSADKKVVDREAGRLETSINEALKIGGQPIVFLHYPPVYGNMVCEEIFSVIKKYNIKNVYHGHIHGAGLNNSVNSFDGVNLKLVSCDCVNFTPVRVQI